MKLYGRKVYLYFGLIKKNLRENSQSLFYKQLLSNERTFILKIDFTDNSKNFRLIFFPAKRSTWWQRIDSGICILQYFIFKPRFCLSVVKIQWHNAIKDPCISESLCIFYSILWLNIRLIKGALKGFQCSALYSLWCMPDTTERQIFKQNKKKKKLDTCLRI